MKTGRITQLAMLAAIVFALTCGGKREQPRFKHVVLISIDTTRADQLGCYGSTRGATPAIDKLASEGVRFQSAMVAAPTTLPSHTALMTGTFPHTHGVPRNQFALDDGNVMLAEVLHEHGFRTGGFIGAMPLSTPFHFRQGFDVWDEKFDMLVGKDGVDQHQRRANEVTDDALAWLDEAKPSRAFLFVHYFDVHAPYAPPPPFDARFTRPSGPKTSTMADIAQQATVHNRVLSPSAPDAAKTITDGLTSDLIAKCDGKPMQGDDDLVALYDGELAFVDSEIARLIDGLRKRGMLDDSIVIVTADHGETFYEHADFYNHGLWVYDTTVHVPLIVRAPGVAPSVVGTPVSSIDVVPTLCEMLGIARPNRNQGVSLAPLLAGQPLQRGPIFCEATQPPRADLESVTAWPNSQKPRCVRIGSLKYIRAPYLQLEQLFDLAADPYEHDDLLLKDPSRAAAELPALRAALDRFDADAHPLPIVTAAQRAKDDKERERIKSGLDGLGYTEGHDKRASDKQPGEPPPKKP
jgi:arylsulfatase